MFGIGRDHGNAVFFFQRCAQILCGNGFFAIQQNNIRFPDRAQFLDGLLFRFHENSHSGMITNDFARTVFRSLFEGHRSIIPRCIDKTGFSVFLKPGRSFHGKANTVDETDARDCSPRCDFRRFFWNKLRFRRHDRFSRCGLRQLVGHSPLSCSRYIREHQLFHESFDKGRFSRTDGTDHADINFSARPCGNPFVNALIFHKKTPPAEYPCLNILLRATFVYDNPNGNFFGGKRFSPMHQTSCSRPLAREKPATAA